MELPGKKLTAEEAVASRLPGGWELVEGEVVPVSPTGGKHGRVVRKLGARLGDHVDSHGLGEVVVGDVGFVVRRNPDTVRGPDVGFVRRDRVPSGVPSGYFEGAPDLAVEVRSPRDDWPQVLRKAGEYLGAGADAVWVIDPDQATASIFTRDGARQIGPDGALEAACLPGLSLRLRDVL